MLFKIRKTGLTHRQKHRPCQDFCMIKKTDSMLLLLAADGHGATAYSRSGLGARIACLAASKILSADKLPAKEYGLRIKETFDRYIKKHLKLHPLSEDALEKLGDAPPEYAYGTTLLAARITDHGTLLLQIGDGELHAVRKNGTLFPELPKDPNCIGNYTSSLVTEDAPAKIRTLFYPEKAGCILLHTDGFEPGNPQLLQLLSSIDADFTYEQLKKAALEGDRRGDDQTLLLYYDENVVTSLPYRNGLQKTIYRFELLREKERLLLQKEELESYFETAMEFVKIRHGDAREQLLTKMKLRYKEYMTVKSRLWSMELKLQKTYPYQMFTKSAIQNIV